MSNKDPVKDKVVTFWFVIFMFLAVSFISIFAEKAHSEVKLADLQNINAQPIQLNYSQSAKPNFVDKIQQARVIEGNQDLARFDICKKVRSEYRDNKLTVQEVTASESCIGFIVLNNLIQEQEKTQRGENKRRSVIQTVGAVAGGIGALAGRSLIGGN